MKVRTMPNTFDFNIFHRVAEVDPVSWDQLSAGRPFTSHQWYRYGETVMADCLPTYLLVYDQGQPIARATFWRSPNEPLAVESTGLRRGLQFVLSRWPLLMCQSPLTSLPGLMVSDSSQQQAILSFIADKAIAFLREQHGSFVIFPYLPHEQFSAPTPDFISSVIPGPGTMMKVIWPDFDAYLQAGNKKDRQHYKRTVREAEKLNIVIRRHSDVDHVDEALELIRNVERRFGSAENPWARPMLEHINMIDGVFLSASIDEKLVGCGLVLQDNGAQVNATLGLAEDVPYTYLMLVYESLKLAFDRHASILRMGSGAYEIKEQLGFSLEDNNTLLFTAANPVVQKVGKWLSSRV